MFIVCILSDLNISAIKYICHLYLPYPTVSTLLEMLQVINMISSNNIQVCFRKLFLLYISNNLEHTATSLNSMRQKIMFLKTYLIILIIFVLFGLIYQLNICARWLLLTLLLFMYLILSFEDLYVIYSI